MHGEQAISLGADIQLIMAGQKLQLNKLSENAGAALVQGAISAASRCAIVPKRESYN